MSTTTESYNYNLLIITVSIMGGAFVAVLIIVLVKRHYQQQRQQAPQAGQPQPGARPPDPPDTTNNDECVFYAIGCILLGLLGVLILLRSAISMTCPATAALPSVVCCLWAWAS